MKTVIFACADSAGRSQIAAAFFNALCSPALVKAVAVGSQPSEKVLPEVVATMKEADFDLSTERPRLLTPELVAGAHLLITMGCAAEYQAAPKLRHEDWAFPEVRGQSPEDVRRIRDEIRRRVWKLLAREGWYKLQPISVVRYHQAMPLAAT